MILLAMDWRLRTRPGRQFSVAFTRRGSLVNVSKNVNAVGSSYLESSWKIVRSLSSKPDASASRLGRARIAWFLGTIAREVSFCSGRWNSSATRQIRQNSCTYPRVRYQTMRLNLDHALHKLDTAHFDRERERVPFPKDVLFNGSHFFPSIAVLWMIDTAVPNVSTMPEITGSPSPQHLSPHATIHHPMAEPPTYA